MGITEILSLLLVFSAGWVVWGNLKAREIANAAIRTACNRHGLLFLELGLQGRLFFLVVGGVDFVLQFLELGVVFGP